MRRRTRARAKPRESPREPSRHRAMEAAAGPAERYEPPGGGRVLPAAHVALDDATASRGSPAIAPETPTLAGSPEGGLAAVSSRVASKPPVLSPRPDASSVRLQTPPPAGLWYTYGPLTLYLMREGITDLFVTGSGELWTDDARSGLRRQDGWNAEETAVRRLAVRLIAHGGRHIDEATPFIDVRLPGGVRVHAVLPPVSTEGTLLFVRIPARVQPRIPDLVESGTLTAAQRAILLAAVAGRVNLLVTGAGGAGKTTLLAAMLAHVPPTERLVVIEDVAELRIPHPHVVGLQARQPNLEGAGGVDLRRLVREALRMRPDRLVLGECRGAEISDLLSALNTGHDGGAGTLHANSIEDVPARLEALGALAGLHDRAVARQAVSAIGMIVHVERSGGRRRVAGFGRLALGGDGRLRVVRDD